MKDLNPAAPEVPVPVPRAIPGAPSCDLFGDGGFFIGCNYWSKDDGMYMWSRWHPETIEKELAAFEANGLTVLRVFPLWSDFQPLTGVCAAGGGYMDYLQDNKPLQNWAGVDEEMMRRFSWFCDAAGRHGLRLVVGLVTGWMSGRQFVPQVFEEKSVTSDPAALMWQTRFVKYFVSRMKDNAAIAAWDLGNECNCLGTVDQASFYNWMDHIGSAIRLADPTRPIVSGMHGLKTDAAASTPIRLNGELMDVLCTHPYPYYVPGCGREAFNTMRTELHPTAESLLYRDLGGRPCFIEEIGNLGTGCTSEARSAAGMRAILFSAWANDLKGLLWWCNADQESLDFQPYTLTACERELGLLRGDLSPKPTLGEMRAFQEFRASLPFAKLPPRRTDAVIVVPEMSDGWLPAFGAYMLAREANIDPVFAGAEHPLPEAPLYIVCSADADTSYTYPAQCRFFAKAREGATVVVLYSGAERLTHLRENTGLEVDYCCRSASIQRFAFDGEEMECADDYTCRLIARECDVLAAADDGNPVFTSFRLGKGRVMLVNAPIDRATVNRSDAIHGTPVVGYYKLLREAAKTAGVKRVVVKLGSPLVGITEHPRGDGSTVVVAVNFEPSPAVCAIRLNGMLGAVWRGDVADGLIRLAPNEAAVFEVR